MLLFPATFAFRGSEKSAQVGRLKELTQADCLRQSKWLTVSLSATIAIAAAQRMR
jgi:hypothetical protein